MRCGAFATTVTCGMLINMLWCGASCTTAGDEIAFTRSGALRIMTLDDAAERVVVELDYERPVTWSPDGRHLLFWKHSAIGWDIWRVDADGGNPVNLTNVESGGCRSAVYSPDGATIAFLRDLPQGVYIMNADGSAPQRLTANGHRDEPPAFSPCGTRLVYMGLEPAGERRVRANLYVIHVNPGIATDGELQNPPAICGGSSASWSRDGSAILFSGQREGNWEILLIAPDGSNERNLTRSAEDEAHPVWSPDGTRVAYFNETTHELGLMNADGSRVQTLATVTGWTWPVTWSPDGRRIAYAGGSRDARSLFVVDVATGKSRRLAQGGVGYPAWRR